MELPPTPGVPSFPRPLKAAPSPRYNDLTLPRALQANVCGGGVLGQSQELETYNGTCGASGAALAGLRMSEASGTLEQELDDGSKSGMPLPWQGSIKLPDGDEDIVNAAQTWILQILHESSKDMRCDGRTAESLTDGRALCRLVNAIAPRSVQITFDLNNENDQVRNFMHFMDACRRFGVPEGALFDASSRDPKRIALCLHVLSRVVQDTVPTFRGPFLSQRASTVSSPRDNNSSASSSTSSNISGREQRLQVLDEQRLQVLDEQRLQVLDATIAPAHLRQQHPGHISSISPSTADLTASNVEFWHNQSPDLQQPRTAQEQQSLSSQQPDLQQHRQTIHCGQLSLPSRLQGVWGGDTLEPRGGARTFTSPLARGFTLRDGEPCPFDDAHQAGASFDKKFEDLVQQQQQQKQKQQLKAAPSFARTAANSLSPWLSRLNLGAFESALVGIGVETTADLCYVEAQDLAAIGMHGPQIRKFMHNRP